MLLRGWLAALCCLVLASCAAPRQPASSACRASWSGRLSALPATPDRSPLLAGFRLELGSDGSGQLALSNPLGQTMVEADWAEGSAHLQSPAQQRDYPSFEAMLSDAIGIALPRQALPSWLSGQPLASVPVLALPDHAFEQLGWRVSPQFADGAVHRLRLERAGGAVLTLLLDQHAECGGAEP